MFSIGELVDGRWEIVSMGGKGTFSRIYVVTDKEANNSVEYIIKTSSESIDSTVLKLEKEVIRDLSGSGRSPAFIDSGNYHGSDYIVMEYYSGERMATIRDRARKNFDNHGFIPAHVAAYFTKEMLAGLQFLHERGYVHRDVKPANFVRTSRASTKFGIIDFGLTKKQSRGRKTVAEFRGTTSYCSPHVHLNQDQSFRDDLYSMMFTFFDLLCGKLPWSNAVKARDKATVAVHKNPCLQNPNYMVDWAKTCFAEHVDQSSGSVSLELDKSCEEQCVLIMNHLNSLDYDDKPDYELIKSALDLLIGNCGVENIEYSSTLFSWEGINVASSKDKEKEKEKEKEKDKEKDNSAISRAKKEAFNNCVDVIWNSRSERIKSILQWIISHNISASVPSTPAEVQSPDSKKYNFEIYGIDNRFNLMSNVAHHLKLIGKIVTSTRLEEQKGNKLGLCANFLPGRGVFDQGLLWSNLFLLLFHNIPVHYWSREVVDLLDATLIESSYFMTEFVTETTSALWMNIQQVTPLFAYQFIHSIPFLPISSN